MPITNGPQPNDDHYAATVMPQPLRQGKPFDPSGSSLTIPNAIATSDGHSAQDFLNKLLPYANKVSPMTTAENQLRGQRNEQA